MLSDEGSEVPGSAACRPYALYYYIRTSRVGPSQIRVVRVLPGSHLGFEGRVSLGALPCTPWVSLKRRPDADLMPIVLGAQRYSKSQPRL